MSFDVAAGACAGMFFFADLLRVKPEKETYWMLAVAVWSIYTFDHLLDAHQTSMMAHSKRHRFHQRYFKPLSWGLAIVSIGGLLFAICVFDKLFLFAGLGLGALIIGSMVLIRYFSKTFAAIKEISIALFYMLGILFAPLWQLDFGFHSNNWALFAFLYFLLAWYNLIYLSYLDADRDKKDGHRSIITDLGKKGTQTTLWILSATGLAYVAFLFLWLPSYYHIYTLILALMFIWHILKFAGQKTGGENVRLQLEAIFLLPWILILLP
ncbi:UbiA family prenyltransferase [Negadavirga shengliensis]|uniref:UbiA family prenyltransferase n=1 Tax=Negadavirga shengliensis TaxID=1389218 RepID=A0ABV9T1I2_9BACT